MDIIKDWKLGFKRAQNHVPDEMDDIPIEVGV